MTFLTEQEWQSQRTRFNQRLDAVVGEHKSRRSRGDKHPVYDFLWEYYSFRPSQLLRWSPGFGVCLGGDASNVVGGEEYTRGASGFSLDIATFPVKRLASLREIIALLRAMAERSAWHGCNGLHEWAMVYRAPTVRHAQLQLRLPPEEIAAVVENKLLRCTHYDAFRFFTPAAVPLNMLQPCYEDRTDMEQRGCIHVNMDLYKWAYKFYPWTDSGIIADAFFLALQAREVDMRASPYDLADLGFEPVRIESADGRQEYQRLQRQIADAAQPIRLRLLERYETLLEAVQLARSAEVLTPR